MSEADQGGSSPPPPGGRSLQPSPGPSCALCTHLAEVMMLEALALQPSILWYWVWKPGTRLTSPQKSFSSPAILPLTISWS